MSTTLDEALDKLLGKVESQTDKSNAQDKAPKKPGSLPRPDPVPVSDVTFYLLYL